MMSYLRTERIKTGLRICGKRSKALGYHKKVEGKKVIHGLTVDVF
jgi:hypothetical protein